jgi:predicted transcriptional regulator of viral defense system
MGTESAPPPVDARIAALAGRQYGVISRAQLIAVGVGPHGISERVRTGRLHRLHRGVFAVGQRSLRVEAHWLAAVLACGTGAVLSHSTAAALWGLRPSASATAHVTIPSRNGRPRRAGIRVHRSSRLALEEVTITEGIPVTTVARTLLDLADVLPMQALKRAIDEAEYRRLFDLTSLTAAVQNSPGRRGGLVLDLTSGPAQRTRSPLEDRLLDLIDRHGLPPPRVGIRIAGYEVDFAWPDHKLIVETDGGAAHRRRSAFESDRLRDRRTLRARFKTIRLTDESMDDEAAVVDDLRTQLQAGASSARNAVSRPRASPKPPRRSSTSSARET